MTSYLLSAIGACLVFVIGIATNSSLPFFFFVAACFIGPLIVDGIDLLKRRRAARLLREASAEFKAKLADPCCLHFNNDVWRRAEAAFFVLYPKAKHWNLKKRFRGMNDEFDLGCSFKLFANGDYIIQFESPEEITALALRFGGKL